MSKKKNKKDITGSPMNTDDLILVKCIDPWKRYRDDIINQKLDLEKQIDKTVFAISSGALGISLAFLDKFSPPIEFKYLYFLLGFGWLCLVVTLIIQLFSFVSTAEKIKDSISKAEDIITSDTVTSFEANENGFYESWKAKNRKIDMLDKSSFWSMIIGIVVILLFAFISLFLKEKPAKTISELNNKALINKIFNDVRRK